MSAVLSPRPEFESARRALWHDYTAAILAGGLGTRLRPAVGDRPKVLAQIGQRPFITFLLDQLTAVGVQKVVLLTGHGANWVRATLGDEYKGVPLGYSVEKAPLGTAGALRHALPMLAADNVLLLNGDSYCELDLAALVAVRRRTRAEIMFAVTHVEDVSRFGQIEMGDDGRVHHFGEKQASGGPGWVNAGVYALPTSVIREIPPGQESSLEKEWLPNWIRSRRVFAFKGTDRFLDIGTPPAYARAASFFTDIEGVSDASP